MLTFTVRVFTGDVPLYDVSPCCGPISPVASYSLARSSGNGARLFSSVCGACLLYVWWKGDGICECIVVGGGILWWVGDKVLTLYFP